MAFFSIPTTPCQALPGAADRLKLFKTDLTEPGSFDKAFEGCTYVIHCASPFILINASAEQVRKETVQQRKDWMEGFHSGQCLRQISIYTLTWITQVRERLLKPAIQGTENVLGEVLLQNEGGHYDIPCYF